MNVSQAHLVGFADRKVTVPIWSQQFESNSEPQVLDSLNLQSLAGL